MKPLAPPPTAKKEKQTNAATILFTALGFFIPGAFNLNYSSMFVMAILTFIVCALFLFAPTEESK
jgi:hypothetical protein